MKILIILLVVAGIMISCSETDTVENIRISPHDEFDNADEISVAAFQEKLAGDEFEGDLKISDVFGDIEIIPLETVQESIISELNTARIKVTEDHIFVLDQGRNHALYVFDKKGRHQFTLDDHGHGPGEFSYPVDFYVNADESLIGLQDLQNMEMNYYSLDDGEFDHEVQTEVSPSSFLAIGDSTYLFHDDSPMPAHNAEHKLVLAKGNSLLDKYMPIKKKRQDFSFHGHHNFWITDDQDTLFYYTFNDTIYHLDNYEPEPRYIIDLGDDQIDYEWYFAEHTRETYHEVRSENNFTWNVQNFFVTEKFKYFTYSHGHDDGINILTAIYDREQSLGEIFGAYELTNDIGEFDLYSWASNVYDDRLVYMTSSLDNSKELIELNADCCIDPEIKRLHLDKDQDFETPNPAVILVELDM